MIRQFSRYDPNTGLFTGEYFFGSDPHTISLNVTDASPAIEGTYDHLSQAVDLATKKVIDYQPPQPSADMVWNATTKRWQLPDSAVAKASAKAAAAARIAQLEASQHRVIRELALNANGATFLAAGELQAHVARLKAIDDEIAKLRPALN